MSNIGDALTRLFSGGPANFTEQLAQLKSEHGSVTAMARELGVDRRTVQRWESGTIRTPRPATHENVGRAWRDATSKDRRLPSDQGVQVGFTQRRKGGGGRSRAVSGEQLGLRGGTMSSSRSAYVEGGGEAAASTFVGGIEDNWYHDVFDDDVKGEGKTPDDSSSDPRPSSVSVG